MADFAVLTKNYRTHLEKATRTALPVAFFSNTRWKTAADRIFDETAVVYFVADGGTGRIEYEGNLEEVIVDPVATMPSVQDLLPFAPDAAIQNGLNEGSIRTLYSVSELKKLDKPFPQTQLLKLRDGKPVSAAYDRGYRLVAPYD